MASAWRRLDAVRYFGPQREKGIRLDPLKLVEGARDSGAPAPVAIVTGGTRGIGRGIAEALAFRGHDLLLTYNTNRTAAEETARDLERTFAVHVELVGGDISQMETRDEVFAAFDRTFGAQGRALRAVVHNAGQYVGVTAENAEGLDATYYGFGDGSMLNEGDMQLDQMHYYQKLYGDAYVDLSERGLARMDSGGSLVGISSPGCTLHYKANLGYDMPGAGKCIMEYAMRLFALRGAQKGVNVNVVVPGVTSTDAWGKLAEKRGKSKEELVSGIASRLAPLGSMQPREVGDAVAYLCSDEGRFITGVSLPVDGGVHLKA